MPSKDSDQSGQLPSLTSLCCLHEGLASPWLSSECTVETLIRLCGCAGWYESSRDAQIILLVLSCFSSISARKSWQMKMLLCDKINMYLLNKNIQPHISVWRFSCLVFNICSKLFVSSMPFLGLINFNGSWAFIRINMVLSSVVPYFSCYTTCMCVHRSNPQLLHTTFTSCHPKLTN